MKKNKNISKNSYSPPHLKFAVVTATWWQGCMVVVAASATAAAGVITSMMGVPMMSDNRHGNPKALKL